MNRAIILDLLTQHREHLRDRFRAKHLALFGSAARDELREDSDIDVLVDFELSVGQASGRRIDARIFAPPLPVLLRGGRRRRKQMAQAAGVCVLLCHRSTSMKAGRDP